VTIMHVFIQHALEAFFVELAATLSAIASASVTIISTSSSEGRE
jgi:hypothetical protein